MGVFLARGAATSNAPEVAHADACLQRVFALGGEIDEGVT